MGVYCLVKPETANPPPRKTPRNCRTPHAANPSGSQVEVVTPIGKPVLGTLERASARWPVRFSLDADGNLTYEHDGRAPHFFTEDLRTVRRLGQAVFLDADGTEWLLSQLVAKPASAEARSGHKAAGRLAAGG